ncbi:hypothetical protein P154DRAFT_578446 [Amniculicola lignicola CBS 123094]|uniref:Uncharacterized protein n=1 Tax=Amniculicola lignicola CBS 123094 TaxID=1392246 RepID=A0A6A5W9W7_9PLEO|nr:hypothetical protein P154DRAFT_578446 [Amniculicola lignicola CBS 123094]
MASKLTENDSRRKRAAGEADGSAFEKIEKLRAFIENAEAEKRAWKKEKAALEQTVSELRDYAIDHNEIKRHRDELLSQKAAREAEFEKILRDAITDRDLMKKQRDEGQQQSATQKVDLERQLQKVTADRDLKEKERSEAWPQLATQENDFTSRFNDVIADLNLKKTQRDNACIQLVIESADHVRNLNNATLKWALMMKERVSLQEQLSEALGQRDDALTQRDDARDDAAKLRTRMADFLEEIQGVRNGWRNDMEKAEHRYYDRFEGLENSLKCTIEEQLSGTRIRVGKFSSHLLIQFCFDQCNRNQSSKQLR